MDSHENILGAKDLYFHGIHFHESYQVFIKEVQDLKKKKFFLKSEFLAMIVGISPVVLLDKGLRLYQKLILPGRNYATTEHSEPSCFT